MSMIGSQGWTYVTISGVNVLVSSVLTEQCIDIIFIKMCEAQMIQAELLLDLSAYMSDGTDEERDIVAEMLECAISRLLARASEMAKLLDFTPACKEAQLLGKLDNTSTSALIAIVLVADGVYTDVQRLMSVSTSSKTNPITLVSKPTSVKTSAQLRKMCVDMQQYIGSEKRFIPRSTVVED